MTFVVSASEESRRVHTGPTTVIISCLCAALFLCMAVIYLGFTDRTLVFDEVGLHNPIYMELHYGRMVYPVHGHFDEMTIHPPTHYLIVAWFMRLGFSLFHAAAVVPCLLFLTLCLVLIRSPYALSVRISILAGVFLGALVWNETYTVRPDVELVLAWVTGLVTMECSRLQSWEPKRLFLGSLLLTYAAAVHYPGFPAGTVVLFYAVWIWSKLPRERAIRLISVAALGVAIVALPYAVLFLIPFRQPIASAVLGVQGQGHLLDALNIHRQAYEVWRQAEPYTVSYQPIIQNLLLPLWHFRLPAVFIGPPLLALFRPTRVLAIACLPNLLFITLVARHKQIGYSGYFAPEIVIYLIAVFIVTSKLIEWAASRLHGRLKTVSGAILALACCAAAFHERPTLVGGAPLQLTRDIDDLDLSRAVSRHMVSPGKLVAGNGAGVWYTSGADHFYMVGTDILFPTSIADLDLRSYFRHFDSIVLDNDQSWVTWNRERITLTSEYIHGDLGLKGFWFGNRRLGSESPLSLLVLDSRADSPVIGYAAEGSRLFRFDKSADGGWIYYSAVCPRSTLANHGQFSFYSTFFLPGPNNDDPRGGSGTLSVIRSLLVSKKQFEQDVVPNSKGCSVRDKTFGSLAELRRGEFLNEFRRTDHRISFYRSLPAALAIVDQVKPGPQYETAEVDLGRLTPASPETTLVRDGDAVRFQTSPKATDAAYLPVNLGSGSPERYLYVEGSVTQGRISVRLSNTGGEAFWGSQDEVPAMAFPLHGSGPDVLVFRSAELRIAGEFVLRRVAVLRSKTPASAVGSAPSPLQK